MYHQGVTAEGTSQQQGRQWWKVFAGLKSEPARLVGVEGRRHRGGADIAHVGSSNGVRLCPTMKHSHQSCLTAVASVPP